ncbi:MAG: hypothetical protein INR64_10995 [Caulobacteraceae bacterium]|nr:hypothetical protein [Caulobacter sp.]
MHSEDSWVFDVKNGLRVWMSEAVKRSEVRAADAEASLRNIDPAKAVDTAEDYTKLLTGSVKDAFGSIGIAKKLARDFGRWWGVRVYFRPGAKGDLVIIRGWPMGRQLLSGTRYRVDNPKIMELQIGKPGIEAAAKESARFGVYLVVAVDLIQFTRDHDLANLLGSLTVDIPSVLLASAIGAAVGTFFAGTVVVGAVALGPALIAFGVGVVVGGGLFLADKHFEITKKVTAAYRSALAKLEAWWRDLGAGAYRQWNAFVNSGVLQDVEKGFNSYARRLGEGDSVFYMLQSLN